MHASILQPFDVVVNAWTSIRYFSQKDDVKIFKQARELSRGGAILFIAETTHSEFISLKLTPTAYSGVDNIVMLENRKYDPIASEISAFWAFYNKYGENLEFVDRVEIEHHIYSLSELSSLLSKAGWEMVPSYGSFFNIASNDPFNKPEHCG